MNDQVQISEGLNNIFAHRHSFIVIGLTGRTGSGCTTVADFLANTVFDTELHELPVPPKSNEDRKERIIREWLKQNWRPFQKIQVSHVIQLLAISDPSLRFEEFVSTHVSNVKSEDVSAVIDSRIPAAKSAMKVLSKIKDASPDEIDSAYQFIFETLPVLSKDIKELLNKDGKKHYTDLFQKLGDNARRSGTPLSDVIDPSKLLVLPEALARIIKLARSRNRRHQKKENYFVIDALRHPFEIRYLRERISPFYAVAVATNDLDRKARLHQNSFIPEEITRLDEKEYPSEIKDQKKKPKGYSAFVSQNIQACIAIADIYISNLGRPEAKDFRDTAQQICRYIALMQHPGLVTPTHIERCMHTAFSAKINSGCISRQVGAVITDANYSIKAVGWNDVPKGLVPCLLRNTAHAVSKRMDATAYSKYEKGDEFLKELKKSKFGNAPSEYIGGRNITFCFKDVYNTLKNDKNQVHTRALHAEENAFLQIAKYGGQGIEGGYLFTTASPCELCAKKAYQLGIKTIYYIDPYPGISNDHILSAGHTPPGLKLFSGAIGRAYHNLYEPIMPYKDELEKIFPQSGLAEAPKTKELDM